MDKNPLEEFKFVDGRGVLHNFLGFKMTAGQQVFGCNCTLKLVCVKFYEVCGKGDIFKIKKKAKFEKQPGPCRVQDFSRS